MGLGEHYCIDLIVAVPYAVGILAFSSEVPERKPPMAVAPRLVLFWLIALRSLPFHPAVGLPLAAATVVIALVAQRRLAARLWTAAE
ncbi:MAG: hypothetical protein WDO73_12020 [Ignavibacteriota bacterium]